MKPVKPNKSQTIDYTRYFVHVDLLQTNDVKNTKTIKLILPRLLRPQLSVNDRPQLFRGQRHNKHGGTKLIKTVLMEDLIVP